MAQAAGHTLVEPVPALVALTTEDDWPKHCSGVTVHNVKIWIDQPHRIKPHTQQSLLFTHRGISGPAVLDISGAVSRLLQHGSPVVIRVNFCPAISCEELNTQFISWQQKEGSKIISSLCAAYLPATVAKALCKCVGLDGVRAADLTKEARNRLVTLLGEGVPVTITGTDGFTTAMVTSGGVALEQLDKRTLQSAIVARLYFAGEVVDIDGPCGGYNLQWAFSSGHLAGMSVQIQK
jgi:predicted Rossmann fold flavoprotein